MVRVISLIQNNLVFFHLDELGWCHLKSFGYMLRPFLCALLVVSTALWAEDLAPQDQAVTQEKVQFTPPPGWRFAETAKLSKAVKVMVVGQAKTEFAPSISLVVEPFEGTLKDYLKIVKRINDSDGTLWKDLGTVQTEAGEASLSQAETKTKWGELRIMHVILLREGNIYILTATAKKEEFPAYYEALFKSLKSLRIEEKQS